MVTATLPNESRFKFGVDRVEEVNVDGVVVQSLPMSSVAGTWSDFVEQTDMDIHMHRSTYTMTSEGNTVTFFVSVFDEEGDYSIRDEHFSVLPGIVMCGMQCAWSLQSDTNKLLVVATMEAVGGKHALNRQIVKSLAAHRGIKPPPSVPHVESSRDRDDVVLLGPAALHSPSFALIGKSRTEGGYNIISTPVAAVADASVPNGVSWTIPNFDAAAGLDGICIDLVSNLATSGNTLEDPDHTTAIAALGAVMLLLVTIGAAVFYFNRPGRSTAQTKPQK
jgi:hypothetical protein